MSISHEAYLARIRHEQRKRRWRETRARLLTLAIVFGAWFTLCVIIAWSFYGFFFL